MFKLTESENTIRTLSAVSVEGYEPIPANATIPRGHRLWSTYEAWLEEGNTPEPFQTVEEREADIQQRLTAAVQRHMDKVAQQRNYDNIISCCTYATSQNPKFSAEGQAAVEWRDEVWVTCYAVLDDVLAGDRLIPTEEELLQMLPVIQWPEVS